MKEASDEEIKAFNESKDMPTPREVSEVLTRANAVLAELEKIMAETQNQELEEIETREGEVLPELEMVTIAETNVGTSVLSEGSAGNGQGPLTLSVKLIEPGFGNAKDGHYYSKEMLRRDAHLFVGAKMYESDHKNNKSTGNWVSTVTGITGFTDTGAPLAEVVVHHPDFAQRVRNLKEKNLLDKLESSILANGKIKKGQVNGQKANIVEQITQALSVDWVTRAGAGGHAVDILESERGKETLETKEVMKVLLDSGLPRTAQLKVAEGEYETVEKLQEAITEWKTLLAEVIPPPKSSAFGLGRREKTEGDGGEKSLAERESAVIDRYLNLGGKAND